MAHFKLGEKITLVDVGNSYPTATESSYIYDSVNTYYNRYKPINASKKGSCIEIEDGYGTKRALSNPKFGLTWRVHHIIRGKKDADEQHAPTYIIGSNKNHMLVVNGKAITKWKK